MNNQIEKLTNILANLGVEITDSLGELVINTQAKNIMAICEILKNNNYKGLVEITAVDEPSQAPRFRLVYMVLNYQENHRVRVQFRTDEDSAVPSICEIYPNANWCEREIWDMYGVFFDNHPDLRRILTDYGFSGHPLRKDFPLSGFVETYYDADKQKVLYKPVDLPQDFRQFDFLSPWKGEKPNYPGDEKATK